MSCNDFQLGSLEISSIVGVFGFLGVCCFTLYHYSKKNIRVHIYIATSTLMCGLNCFMYVVTRPLAACCSTSIKLLEALIEEFFQDVAYCIYILLVITRVNAVARIYPFLPRYHVLMNVVAVSLTVALISLVAVDDYLRYFSVDMDLINLYTLLRNIVREISLVGFFSFNFIMNYAIARGVIKSTISTSQSDDNALLKKARSLYTFLLMSMIQIIIALCILYFIEFEDNDPLHIFLYSFLYVLLPGHFLAEWYYQRALSEILNHTTHNMKSLVKDLEPPTVTTNSA